MKVEINKLENGNYAFLIDSDDYFEIEIARKFIVEMIESYRLR